MQRNVCNSKEARLTTLGTWQISEVSSPQSNKKQLKPRTALTSNSPTVQLYFTSCNTTSTLQKQVRKKNADSLEFYKRTANVEVSHTVGVRVDTSSQLNSFCFTRV